MRLEQIVVYFIGSVQKVVYFIGSSVLCTESSVLCVRCTLPVELRDGRLHCVRDCTLEMELRESHFSHSLSSVLCVQFISVLPVLLPVGQYWYRYLLDLWNFI